MRLFLCAIPADRLAGMVDELIDDEEEPTVDAYSPERQRQVRVQLAEALRGVVAQLMSVLQTGRAEGMTTMRQCVEQRVASGLVAADEAR